MSTGKFGYRLIKDYRERSSITDRILHALPEWFGREDAIQDYILGVNDPRKTFVGVYENNKDDCIGFMTLSDVFEKTADVYLIAVEKNYHGRGIGTELIGIARDYCLKNKKNLLTVKTLGKAHPDVYYARTREFYLGRGFFEIEENDKMWGDIPCLILGLIVEEQD